MRKRTSTRSLRPRVEEDEEEDLDEEPEAEAEEDEEEDFDEEPEAEGDEDEEEDLDEDRGRG